MSTPVSKVLGKGVPFIFGEKTYTLSPLTYSDQALFERWLEDRAFAALERRRSTLPDDEYKLHYNNLVGSVAMGDFAFGGLACAKIAKTVPGLKELFFLSVVKNHPEVTRQTVDEIFDKKAEEASMSLTGANSDPKAQTPETPANQ